MDPSFRYATVRYDTDGVETDWEISFSGGYISQSHVGAYSTLKEEVPGLGFDRQEHALTFVSEGPTTSTVRITPAVANNRVVTIYRDTPKTDIMVEFEDGKVVNRSNLDLANRQAIFGLAELLDSVLDANLNIGLQSANIVNISELIQEVYDSTLEILAASGIVSVLPRVWVFSAEADQSEFPLPGADLTNPGFYDTYVAGQGIAPGVDYEIIVDPVTSLRVLKLADGVAADTQVFAVLRGFARPYIGEPPVTNLRHNVFYLTAPTIVDGDHARAVLATSSDTALSHTIKKIPVIPAVDDMRTGDEFYVVQRDTGQVTLVGEDGDVNLEIPAGYLAATRALNSTISAFCLDQSTNTWVIGGDLALE